MRALVVPVAVLALGGCDPGYEGADPLDPGRADECQAEDPAEPAQEPLHLSLAGSIYGYVRTSVSGAISSSADEDLIEVRIDDTLYYTVNEATVKVDQDGLDVAVQASFACDAAGGANHYSCNGAEVGEGVPCEVDTPSGEEQIRLVPDCNGVDESGILSITVRGNGCGAYTMVLFLI